MGLTKDQTVVVVALKPLIADLLRDMLKPSTGSKLSGEKRLTMGGGLCKAVVTIQDGGGADRYRLFVQLSHLSNGTPVTLTEKDVRVFDAELRKAAEAVGWLWVMGANLEPGTFGVMVTPRG